MLIDLIKSLISGDTGALISIMFLIPIVIFSLTVHECAHGLAAKALGDPTAKACGRLTLNPFAHLDPVGALMMLIFGFGWAKPVPINPNYFKNRKRGMAITALAGPVSNLILSFLAILIFRIFSAFVLSGGYAHMSLNFINVFVMFLSMFAYLNATLAIFNLIPVPPLDGSRILNVILPEKYYFSIMKYERYIYLGVIVLLFTGLLSTPLSFLAHGYVSLTEKLISLIPGL